MRYKIEFFHNKLKPDSGIKWEMPIAHLTSQTFFATTIGDSLLEGTGGFFTILGFWWHICFPDEVVWRTLQFKTKNNNGMLVPINVLEFVMVIINYCAILHVVWTSPITKQSPSCNPQRHQQFCCSVLDTPHVQVIKIG